MRTTLNINIPKPCQEDWNQMTPKQKGRHCTSCKKTVFDFTRSTDEQIVKTFLKEDNVCGRFKSTQLNRELVLNRKEKNKYLSYVASTLFAFLSFGTQDIQAQGKSRIVKVDSLQPQMVNEKTGTSILNKKPVRGTLFGPNKDRVPGAKITIKGSAASTNTDMSGNFIIKGELGNILIIDVDGYEKTEIIINNFASHQIYLKSKSFIATNVEVEVYSKKTNERLIKGMTLSKFDGLPLPGVTVINLRSKTKTESDFDGNFSMKAKIGDTINMKFIGMSDYDLLINQSSVYKIELDEDPNDCGENLIYAGVPDFYEMTKCLRRKVRKEKRENIKKGVLERTTMGKLLYTLSNVFRKKE
ncbi:MAG: hypothetical protein ACJA1H_002374 [Glaciecola sp.]|jgi:hypothetical protein